MCILFIFLNSTPKPGKFRVILASNRDEFFERPTSPAKLIGQDPQIISGEDKMKGREGGTWLGVSSYSKISSLLNLSSGFSGQKGGMSRGFLVKNYLNSKISATDYINQIETSGILYDSFSLIFLNFSQKNHEAYCYNNVEKVCDTLVDGVHGFSNSVMNKPYQKVIYGKNEFENIINKFNDKNCKKDLENALFSFMHNRTKHFPDEILSAKGAPKHLIPELSSKFVYIPEVGYGTRTTTLILVDDGGNVNFTEKTSNGDYSDIDTWLHSEYGLQSCHSHI